MSSGWSIDELARLTGVPSRTIREYRTLGLLPAPERVGRVGVYGPEHRRRLDLIGRLQTRGYSLAGIKDLLVAWSGGRSLDDVIGDAPFDETPVAVSDNELAAQLPPLAQAPARRAAAAAGLIHPAGDDRWLVRSHALLTLVGDLLDAGVSLDTTLDTVCRLREHAAAQGELLADVFVDEIWTRNTADSAVAVARRARPLIAQAVASLVADAAGTALVARASADDDRDLAALVEALRVGTIIELPSAPVEEHP